MSPAYVTTSKTYTAPTPQPAMRRPAIAGPTSRARLPSGWMSAYASMSRSRGTSAGMSACRAGVSKVAAPDTTAVAA